MNNKHFEKYNEYMVSESITLKEEFNESKAKVIFKHFDILYDNGKIGKFKDESFRLISREAAKTMFEKFVKRKSRNVVYTYTTKLKKYRGRLFAKQSFQGMNKILRHTLSVARDDWDIVNCHLVIAEWLNVGFEMNLGSIKDYCENREERLLELSEVYGVSRDEGKEIVLQITNGGGKGWFKMNGKLAPIWLQLFNSDMINLRNMVVRSRPDLVKIDGKSFNQDGSCFNLLLCEIENKILNVMYEYCLDNHVDVATLCFDGFMTTGEAPVGFEVKLQNYVKEVLDIDIMILKKPMDKGLDLRDMIEDEVEEEKLSVFDNESISDEACGLYIINQLYKDEVLYYSKKLDQLYLFNEETVLYEEIRPEILMTKISKILKNLFVELKLTENLKRYSLGIQITIQQRLNSATSTIGQKLILKQMLLRLKDHSKFIEKNFDVVPYLFPIANNKIINFRTNIIEERTKVHYFTFFVDIEYNKEIDEEEVKAYLRELLIEEKKDLTEDDVLHIECFLDTLGYLVTNENNLKIIPFFIGRKHAGKTTFCNKLKPVLGDFQITVHKKVFCQTKSSSNHEAELFPLINKRVGFFSEFGDDDKPNEDQMKRISGNDGGIPARGCGAKKQVELDLHLKQVMSSNTIWSSSDEALQSRLLFFTFPNKFEPSEVTEEKIQKIESLDLGSVVFKRAHKFYKQDRKIKLSEQVKDTTKLTISDIDPIKQFFITYYKVTENATDIEKFSDIFQKYQDFTAENMYRTMGKIKFLKKFEESFNPAYRQVSHFTNLKKKEVVFVDETPSYLNK